jgi:hypothetical protein
VGEIVDFRQRRVYAALIIKQPGTPAPGLPAGNGRSRLKAAKK